MKILIFTSAIILSSLSADNQKNNLDLQIKSEILPEEQAMLEMLGYMTVYRDGLKELGFGSAEAEYIARGLKKALEDNVMDKSYQEKMSDFQAYIEKRIEENQSINDLKTAKIAEENIKNGNEFLNNIATDETVKSTPSGLHYKILKKGKSVSPKISDTVRVHYKGSRIDGTVFDSSYTRGQPADFPLGGVVPGFAEGLTKVGEGGQIILYIPSDIAYGESPMRGGIIQPGDTLIFECELIKINP